VGTGGGGAVKETNKKGTSSMAKRITSQTVEESVRTILKSEGYDLSPRKTRNGETGVDILASKKGQRLFIEVIGYKTTGPARAKDFFEVFFRAISRLKDGATKCMIALPLPAQQGLPQRATNYGEAWSRLGRAFPELEVWLVDSEHRRIEKSPWNAWLPS
jgi:Holliday junction resolvase-like predicted endonuclease